MAITQQQIAELAGVSRGTVDRALNNRGKVNPDVAARILKIAEQLGYRPNRAGSLLVRTKRPLRIGVIIQSVETPFMSSVLRAIEGSRARMQELGAELLVYSNEKLDPERQLIALKDLQDEKVDGIVLTPIVNDAICAEINRAASSGIPVITFNTDIPGSARLCYIGLDNYLSGRTCAGLMNLLLGGEGTVLMITGYQSNLSQQRRIDGFCSETRAISPHISLLPLEQCGDSDETAYEIVKRVLHKRPDVRGIYFSAGGPSGGCRALLDQNLVNTVHLIGHDRTELNVKNVQDGVMDFLIDQHADVQAIRPLEILLDYILSGIQPAEEYWYTPITILNRYNI